MPVDLFKRTRWDETAALYRHNEYQWDPEAFQDTGVDLNVFLKQQSEESTMLNVGYILAVVEQNVR
jgi:hypothetical protein